MNSSDANKSTASLAPSRSSTAALAAAAQSRAAAASVAAKSIWRISSRPFLYAAPPSDGGVDAAAAPSIARRRRPAAHSGGDARLRTVHVCAALPENVCARTGASARNRPPFAAGAPATGIPVADSGRNCHIFRSDEIKIVSSHPWVRTQRPWFLPGRVGNQGTLGGNQVDLGVAQLEEIKSTLEEIKLTLGPLGWKPSHGSRCVSYSAFRA